MPEEKRNPDLREQYRTGERFRRYVNRFSAACMRTVEETLELALVREVAGYYREEEAWDAGRAPAGKSTYTPMGECV